MTYKPQPVNTSGVQIPHELVPLIEELARNAHEVWAQQRISDGWSYGPERDDRRKETPCLVPYEDLSESEKEYDRKTAKQMLKALLALGFRIDGGR